MEETTPTIQTDQNSQVESPAPKEAAPVQPTGDIQAVIAYIPFLFIVAALQRLDDETLMFHAKNGAGLTLLFIVATFVSAWLHVLTGSLLMLVYLVPSILGAFHGWKNEKWSIPGISSWAQNIPMEKWFREKHEENVKESEDTPAPSPVVEAPTIEPLPSTEGPIENNNQPNTPNS